MKSLFIFLALGLSGVAKASDFQCFLYATTTSSRAPEILHLEINGNPVHFGSNDRNRGAWSLALSSENIDGYGVLELTLLTGRQAAAVSSARVDSDAQLIGLTLNTDLFADVICSKL